MPCEREDELRIVGEPLGDDLLFGIVPDRVTEFSAITPGGTRSPPLPYATASGQYCGTGSWIRKYDANFVTFR